MSFEAIAGIAKAEADAKELIAAAEVKARQMSAEAENEGKAAVEAARAKADSELTELRKQADAKAMTEAGELSPQRNPCSVHCRRSARTFCWMTAASARHWQQRMRYPQTRIA